MFSNFAGVFPTQGRKFLQHWRVAREWRKCRGSETSSWEQPPVTGMISRCGWWIWPSFPIKSHPILKVAWGWITSAEKGFSFMLVFFRKNKKTTVGRSFYVNGASIRKFLIIFSEFFLSQSKFGVWKKPTFKMVTSCAARNQDIFGLLHLLLNRCSYLLYALMRAQRKSGPGDGDLFGLQPLPWSLLIHRTSSVCWWKSLWDFGVFPIIELLY